MRLTSDRHQLSNPPMKALQTAEGRTAGVGTTAGSPQPPGLIGAPAGPAREELGTQAPHGRSTITRPFPRAMVTSRTPPPPPHFQSVSQVFMHAVINKLTLGKPVDGALVRKVREFVVTFKQHPEIVDAQLVVVSDTDAVFLVHFITREVPGRISEGGRCAVVRQSRSPVPRWTGAASRGRGRRAGTGLTSARLL